MPLLDSNLKVAFVVNSGVSPFTCSGTDPSGQFLVGDGGGTGMTAIASVSNTQTTLQGITRTVAITISDSTVPTPQVVANFNLLVTDTP